MTTGPQYENKLTLGNIIQILTLLIGLAGFGFSLKSELGFQAEKLREISSQLKAASDSSSSRFSDLDNRIRTLETSVVIADRRLEEVESELETKGPQR